jgi:hypothetical protein
LQVEEVQPAVPVRPQRAMEAQANNSDRESHTPLTRDDGLEEFKSFEVKHGPVDLPTAILVEKNEPLPSFVGQKTQIMASNYILSQNAFSPAPSFGLPAPVLYVSITLERLMETTSWGLGVIKENAGIAFIVYVGLPTKDGPTVTWCEISNPATKLSTMQHDEAKCLGCDSLLVPRLIPGDAIISINGTPISAFPNIDIFILYARRLKKMEIVALRHSLVWSAAQVEESRSMNLGHLAYPQAKMDRVSASVREVWMRILAFISDDHKFPDSASGNYHFNELTRFIRIYSDFEIPNVELFRGWIKDQSYIFERFMRHTMGMSAGQIGLLKSSFDWNSNVSDQVNEQHPHNQGNADQGRLCFVI